MIRSALPFLLLASPLRAQETRKMANVPRFNRKAFIAEVSLLATAKTADAITTRQLLDRGGTELKPIFGSNPSPAKQSLINLGFFAAQSGVFYLTEHNRHAWVGRARARGVTLQIQRIGKARKGHPCRYFMDGAL